MKDLEILIEEIHHLVSKFFPDAIIWDQKNSDFIGKYLYVKFEETELGIFLGSTVNESGQIKACIALYFTNPVAALTATGMGAVTRLLHRLLIRSNLKLKKYPFKIMSGKYPAILRTMHFEDNSFNIEKSMMFFNESLKEIRKAEPVYSSIFD